MTGLRQGELVGLRWLDADWPARRVRVADSCTRGAFDSPKSHRGRTVPIGDRLAGELERHFQRSRHRADDDLVFCHPLTGHVLDASKLRKRFAVALERAGVHAITFHELRHAFGPQMAAAGAPLRAIQEWRATPTQPRPRSTPTTRPTRRAARSSPSARSGPGAGARAHRLTGGRRPYSSRSARTQARTSLRRNRRCRPTRIDGSGR